MYPSLAAYHPSFIISDGDKCTIIEVDLNDWYNDKEILDHLSQHYEVKTAGELVNAIQNKPFAQAITSPILGARIKEVTQGDTIDVVRVIRIRPSLPSAPKKPLTPESSIRLEWDSQLN